MVKKSHEGKSASAPRYGKVFLVKGPRLSCGRHDPKPTGLQLVE